MGDNPYRDIANHGLDKLAAGTPNAAPVTFEPTPIRRFILFSITGMMLGRGATLPGGLCVRSIGNETAVTPLGDIPATMLIEWLDPEDDDRWPPRYRSQTAAIAARLGI